MYVALGLYGMAGTGSYVPVNVKGLSKDYRMSDSDHHVVYII